MMSVAVELSITQDLAPTGACRLHIQGELDIYTAPELAEALASVTDSQSVVVDLRRCRYIDSSTISVLLRWRKTSKANMRILVGRSGAVARVLQITHVDSVIPVTIEDD